MSRRGFREVRKGRKASSHCRSPRERVNEMALALSAETSVSAPVDDLETEPFAIIRINGSIVVVAVGGPG
jgi:hypothetical protein